MKQVNDIWLGDSVKLCKRFEAKKLVNCVITDPPFGVDNLSNFAVTEGGKANARKIANDESPEIAIATFKDVMNVLLPCTTADADIYIFTSYQVLSSWLVMTDEFLPRHGFQRKALLVWEKTGPGMGDTESWGSGAEFIIFAKKGRRASTDRRRNSVIHVPQLSPTKLIHPHEKPTTILAPLISHSTSEGDFIVDPFGGSGSLARAARELNRSAICIELDEHNYNRAKQKLDTEGDGIFG